MEIKEYMQLINTFEAMKRNTRHSWLSDGRRESVAEHSWRLTFMAYFVRDEFPGIDVDRLIKMCLFHDIGEAFTGDVPAFLKTDADRDIEGDALGQFIGQLPEAYRTELGGLFAEMEAMETLEAKVYKALDRMEAVIQHNEADISTWLPLEYDLQMTYGEKEVQFSEYMKGLKAEANRISEEKILKQKEDY